MDEDKESDKDYAFSPQNNTPVVHNMFLA